MAAAVWAEVMTGRFVSCSGCDVGWLIQATGAVQCWKSIRACRKNRRAAERRFRGGQGELNIAPTVRITLAFKIYLCLNLLKLFFVLGFFFFFHFQRFYFCALRSALFVFPCAFPSCLYAGKQLFPDVTLHAYIKSFEGIQEGRDFQFHHFVFCKQTNKSKVCEGLNSPQCCCRLKSPVGWFHHCNRCFKADFCERRVSSTLQQTPCPRICSQILFPHICWCIYCECCLVAP